MQHLKNLNKFYFIFFIIFLILIPITLGGINHVNYERHFERAINLFSKHYHVNAYPLMFICIKFVNEFFNSLNINLNWKYIFATVLVPAYFFRILLVYFYCKFRNINSINSLIISCGTVIIFTPFYIYLGHRSYFFLNDVADPTTLFSYPFALALYFFTIKNIEFILEKKNFLIFLVLLSLSVFSKPTYAISFLPGLFIFILLKNFSNLKNFYSKFKFQIIFILISSFSIIGLSSFIVLKGYYSIDINPMAAWLIRTNGNLVLLMTHWIVSLMLPLIFFLNVWYKKEIFHLNDSVKLAVIIFFISILYSIFFADGFRIRSANFLQQVKIPFNILILEIAIFIFSNLKKNLILLFIYLLHIYWGFVYFYRNLKFDF